MRKKGMLFGAFFLVGVALAKEPISKTAQFAKDVRAVVASLEKTVYQHKTEIDQEAKSYLCDCSGFLGYLLEQEFPEAYASLDDKEAKWSSRPLAVNFHDTFVHAGKTEVPGWLQVEKLTDVRPGDLIAWRRETVLRGKSTGHVALVVENLGTDIDGRVRLRVVDSTSRIHADDTRPDGTDGVGEGTMWFAMDDSGRPTAYYVDGSGEKGKSNLIAIGRLK